MKVDEPTETHIRTDKMIAFMRRLFNGEGYYAEPGSLQPNCINCLNFQETTQRCSLNAMTPPPMIAAKGCEMWRNDMDNIPF